MEAMANEPEKTKIPSQIIFENLKELLRAKNTAHESMFKFHWKKMWPFSLIWPQVDYERIVRLMSEIRKNAIIQKNLVLQAKNVAKEFEKEFLDAVPAYLDALDGDVVDGLAVGAALLEGEGDADDGGGDVRVRVVELEVTLQGRDLVIPVGIELLDRRDH